MMNLARIEAAGRVHALDLFGGFHPDPDDPSLPPGTQTLLLLGPAEPGFWLQFTASPEWQDGAPDPLDRWSKRVITTLAESFNATALFPFGGPPHRPFYQWALATGRAWPSPVTLLVHDRAGLMVSYRGALALPERLALPATGAAPCLDCADKPCLAACPTGALTGKGYDVPACHRFLDTEPGADCLQKGCTVRRACPISKTYARLPEQSAYHMGLFHQ